MESIILASGSLRRQEYFRMLCMPFKTLPPQIDESNTENLGAEDLAISLAQKKIDKILDNFSGQHPLWVFSADTLVSLDGKVFGKCKSREEAEATLSSLSGREHTVITACALYSGRQNKTVIKTVFTKVFLKELTKEDIEWYIDCGEWQGSAGAYKIQGLGGCLVKKIEGSFSNVVGLPLSEFYDMLIENGYPLREQLLMP